jgi:hypothetical protein
MEHPAYFFFLYRELRRDLSFMRPSCLTLVPRSLFEAAGACRRLNQISSSLSGISFRGYPVPLCAFLFLSTGRSDSPPHSITSLDLPTSPSRVPCAFGTIDIPSRAHSQRVDSTSFVRCTDRARLHARMSFCARIER